MLLPLYLFAQKTPTSCRVYCPDGSSHLVDCNSNVDPCTGGGGGGTFSKSPGSAGFLGGALGALGGSLLEDPNGNSQWEAGGFLGMGLFMALNLILRPIKRSRIENILLGGLTVGALTYGTVKLAEAMATPTTPAEPDKTSLIPLVPAVAAGTGALVGMAWHVKLKNNNYTQSRKKRFMSDMVFTTTGNKVGIIVPL